MPRSYSSTATADDAVSTEGITFTLDDVVFTCHGRISQWDLAEFAGPAADADEAEGRGEPPTPAVVRVLGDLTHVVLGDPTYRQFTLHRRKHMTPDEVTQQILLDVIEDATSRPFHRRSPSPAGPPATVSSPAGSPSPAGLARSRKVMEALVQQGEVILADTPGPAPAATRPGRIRHLSLSRPGVTITDQPGSPLEGQTG